MDVEQTLLDAEILADKWREAAKRDDVLSRLMVPSDVRTLVQTIDDLVAVARG